MKYRGTDKYAADSANFIRDFCNVKREECDGVSIEIDINTKDKNQHVGGIKGFFYDYEEKKIFDKFNKGFHIKSLGVEGQYLEQGIATYLMKEVIRYAERQNVKHITVNPVATTIIIKQEELEKFYKKFSFNYKNFCFHKEREIEFKTVDD